MTTTVDLPPERDRAMQIVREALDLPEAQRDAFVNSVCGSDAKLLAEVRSMLAAAEMPTTGPLRTAEALAHPTKVGPYHILEPLGEGGMGTVYKAEQRQPIKRVVALKLIKLGFDTKEVIARFESERQALARMDHPGIAKVIDAGVTETGRPFFVMEYVPGMPITRFADERKLTIKQRLELFVPLCDAIAHAHTKAIIHRDIKAANVLAYVQDGKPAVKVIDFGIAKALTGERLTDQTLNTSRGGVVGTLDSMSPEQADGVPDIDTRTDVYSLGVLLYELLTGLKPFDGATMRSASHEEIKRIIREVEPPRPSTRLAGETDHLTRAATARRAEAGALTRELKGELEWIPLKAMRKDRERRYASPLQLAEDIRNYLEQRPLLAGPESRVYVARKYLRRHWRAMSVAAAMFLLITTLTALYIRQIRAEQRRTAAALAEAQRQKAEAERRREEAVAVNSFLTEDVLSGARPENLPDKTVRDVIVQKMIDPAASAVIARFKDKPLVEAAIRDSLALTYEAIGHADLGVPHASAALEIHRKQLGNEHRDTLGSMATLATLLQAQGKLAEAYGLYREALDGARRVLGPNDLQTLMSAQNLGSLLREQGNLDESLALNRDTLERSRRALGNDHPATLNALNGVAATLQSQDKFAEAEPLFREALDLHRRVLGPDHPNTLGALNNLAAVLQRQGKLAEAEPLLREVVEREQRVLGDDHPQTLSGMSNLGFLLYAEKRPADAEPVCREAVGRRRRVLGNDHPDTETSINNLALVLLAQHKMTEAEALGREALELRRRTLGGDHADTLQSINNLAFVLHQQGKFAEAEALCREGWQAARRVLGADHPDTLHWMTKLQMMLRPQGKLDELEAVLREEISIRRAKSGPRDEAAAQAATELAELLEQRGRHDDAAAVRRDSGLPQPGTRPAAATNRAPE